ncbi:diguanylate cyclase (GGDEF)-like protein [Plasticicumulans lactativorans]|uniref:cyclic-guanylate-specific phosphodiesterase n=1 Tax=Plasticicumulans lactativorans TaxID=1133106 RepID=A0A4R2KXF5_9GAMM|nr:EAL domain-containing protein [Plasticicumulans lactativorans]TCO76009.1 diguanylate cyclase (GGDEF)-like protein [Plasticicumulans lactativorans]
MRLRFFDRLSIRQTLLLTAALAGVLGVVAGALGGAGDVGAGLAALAVGALGAGAWVLGIERALARAFEELSQLARRAGHDADYTLRSEAARRDAIGRLGADLNDMLERIERRDLMLAAEVSARTRELEDLNAQLHHQAFHDTLTGLPNRALFDDRLEQAVAYSRRHQRRIAVMFLDLDNFKTINDTLGHAAGDELLMLVAERICQVLREVDTVSRFGGDEFTILLLELSPDDYAEHIARRLIDNFEHPFFIQNKPVTITTSIGITIFPDDVPEGGMTNTLDLLKRNADAAMYTAKDAGKNTYQFFEEHMNRAAQEHLSMQLELRRALQENELHVYYQPVVDLRQGRTIGLEALVRWRHPEKGELLPGAFIPFAEKFGLIAQIDQWVLAAVCRQWRDWQAQLPPGFWVAVNLSAASLKNHGLVDEIAEVLYSHGVPASAIVIELTESQLMENARDVLGLLQGLRELGLRLSIDDFGTGYSSLAYLRQFHVDALKIDRSFVHDLGSHDAAAIVSTIVAMARNLKLRVIAEGVETPAQLEVLRGLACDCIQGFLYAAPLPPAAVPAQLHAVLVPPGDAAPDPGAPPLTP